MEFHRFLEILFYCFASDGLMKLFLCHICHHVSPDHTQFLHHVYLDPKKTINKRSTFQKFRIHLSYDRSLQSLSNEKLVFIKDNLLPRAVKYWEETLEVRPLHSKIMILRQCKSEKVRYKDNDSHPFCIDGCAKKTLCGDVEVPNLHLDACRQIDEHGNFVKIGKSGSGIQNADFVLYVSALSLPRCQIESTVAYAAYCRLENILDRPVAGYVNLCPDGISTKSFDEHQMHFTIKHEILHALGFSSGLFAFFRDHQGNPLTPRSPATNKPPYNATLRRYQWSDKVVKTLVRSDWIVRKGIRNKTVNVVVTPAVVREVRRHFNCNSAEGAELEDQGLPGTSMTHWEKRMFENEVMTGTYTQNLVISRITLALMEDTGWYKVDYEKSGHFVWGRNLGCDFVQKSCLHWILTRKSRNESIHPFCEKIKTKFIQTECSLDSTAVALCNLISYQDQLPDEYQHFIEIPNVPETNVPFYGGSVALADYCPYVQEFNWKKDDVVVRGSRCSISANNPVAEENYLIERYGPHSMCFEHASDWTVQHCYTTHQVESWGSGCYKFACDARGLNVIFGNISHRCLFEGQVVKAAVASSDWLHRGSIVCPKIQNLCSDLTNSSMVGEDFPNSELVPVPCSAPNLDPHFTVNKFILYLQMSHVIITSVLTFYLC